MGFSTFESFSPRERRIDNSSVPLSEAGTPPGINPLLPLGCDCPCSLLLYESGSHNSFLQTQSLKCDLELTTLSVDGAFQFSW